MEKFDINGAIIEFSEEQVRYNSIRKEFLEQALKYKLKMKKDLLKKSTKREISNYGIEIYKDFVEDFIKRGVEIVVNYGIITIDTNLFKKNYCLKYLNYIEQSKYIPKEYITKHKKISLAQKSIEDKKLINKLSDNLFDDCFKVHYAVIDALLDNGVDIIASYVKEKDVINSNALFNNYKDGFIDKTSEVFVVKQIISLNPYRKDIYEFFIKEDGDFNKEIERLTEFLGYDVKYYKEQLMDEYVENIEISHNCDIEIEKEKIEKYAKYIGFDKKDIYSTRIEALYLYQNA